MSETKFTPPPWYASPRSEGDDWDIWTANDTALLSTVFGDFDVTPEQGKANADLIAAAPELYKALDAVRMCVESGVLMQRPGLDERGAELLHELGPQLAAALAKARGEGGAA